MRFRYRARTKTGQALSGFVSARSQENAEDILRGRDLIIVEVSQDNNSKNLLQRILRRVPLKSQIFFLRQLAAMLETGIGLDAAFDIIIEQERSFKFKSIITEIKNKLKDSGGSLSIAMSDSLIFDDMTLSIIQAEEEAGKLTEGLERAADLLEKRGGFKAKIFKAMLYPTLVLILALVVLIVFIVYIMPGFQQVFMAMNIELPAVTKFILSLGDYFTQNFSKIFLSLLLIIVLFIFISRLKFTRPLIDKLKLKLPFIKNLVFKSAMANSTRTLAALTAAGVPIISALNMAGDTAGNVVIQNAFESMAGQAAKGVPLGEAANDAEVFPTLVTQMMRIGQETGNLEGMMDRVASWYDQELSNEISVVSSLLEPLMIVIVGIVVGVMVVALIGPVTSAMSQI